MYVESNTLYIRRARSGKKIPGKVIQCQDTAHRTKQDRTLFTDPQRRGDKKCLCM